ncbi:MAG TPA: hypothetical protein PLM24_04730 [Methanothrix sp.]|nr:hypothetical protein [Methanothrix sp.]
MVFIITDFMIGCNILGHNGINRLPIVCCRLYCEPLAAMIF